MSSYPTSRDPKKIIAVIVIVVVLVIAGYSYFAFQQGGQQERLVVYTYDSFMAWGEDPSGIDDTAFGEFEQEHNIDVVIERLQTDAKGIITRLGAESSNPVADVVIGIDNVQILEHGVKDVLSPYTPTNIDVVNDTLVDYLEPDHYLTPFDFGLVALIYNKTTTDLAEFPELENLTFADLSQGQYASALVTENPHFSSPGLAFLLSEIAVQEKLLGNDWTEWWNVVKDNIDVQPGWTEAWYKWDEDDSIHLLNSYGTDPAYDSYWTGEEPNTAVATIYHNEEHYAWMQVEGMGLVKNGPNPEIAKLFLDYCLDETVQSLIATNQWMLPVRNGVDLDPAFEYALHPDDVKILNELLPRSEIAANLTTWLNQYDEIMT